MAMQFASSYVQSGRSFPSFSALLQMGVDMVDEMERETMRRDSRLASGHTVKPLKLAGG